MYSLQDLVDDYGFSEKDVVNALDHYMSQDEIVDTIYTMLQENDIEIPEDLAEYHQLHCEGKDLTEVKYGWGDKTEKEIGDILKSGSYIKHTKFNGEDEYTVYYDDPYDQGSGHGISKETAMKFKEYIRESSLHENLVKNLLSGGSVREVLEAFTDAENSEEILGGNETTPIAQDVNLGSGDKLLHVFIRRIKKGETEPYKRVKITSLSELIITYFEWVARYRNETVEIWSDNALDIKAFYRYVLENKDSIEDLYKNSRRMRQANGTFAQFIRQVQIKSRTTATQLKGSLYPFVCEAPTA